MPAQKGNTPAAKLAYEQSLAMNRVYRIDLGEKNRRGKRDAASLRYQIIGFSILNDTKGDPVETAGAIDHVPPTLAADAALLADAALPDGQADAIESKDGTAAPKVFLKVAAAVARVLRRAFKDKLDSGVLLTELLDKLPKGLRKAFGEDRKNWARKFREEVCGGRDVSLVTLSDGYTLGLVSEERKPAVVYLRQPSKVTDCTADAAPYYIDS